MVTHIAKSMDQPGKVAKPARGQLAPENLVSRDVFGSPVLRQPAHLHTQAESGAYLRDSSRVPRRRPFIYFKPPYTIGPVPSLLGHVNAYRWRSLPSFCRLRASKPQGSTERVLPWQVTMDQLIYASLSHTHHWYELGMLKVLAICTLLTVLNCCANYGHQSASPYFTTYFIPTFLSTCGCRWKANHDVQVILLAARRT